MFLRRFIEPALPVYASAMLLLTAGPAASAVVDGLYTATVARRSDVSDARNAAIADAMTNVLVRVTGSRQAATAPELEFLRAGPDRYVESFVFLSTSEALVSFLPRDIERELAAAGWPLWGAERPLSMLWIAVTDQFGDQALVAAGGPPPDAQYSANMQQLLNTIREDVTTIAAQRGLPWVLPDFASAEDVALQCPQVWDYRFEELAAISAAWDADATVIARVRQSVIGTDVEWLLQSESQYLSYPGAGIADGIHWLADAYAGQYSSVGGWRPLTLRVHGVADFDTYARVLAYLESVSVLTDVDVEAFSGGELQLRTQSRGDTSVVSRTLGLDDVVRERPAGIGMPRSTDPGVLDLLVVPERPVFFGNGPPPR